MAHMLGVKLGALFVKTLTKPIANQLKKQAAAPGWFRSVGGMDNMRGDTRYGGVLNVL